MSSTQSSSTGFNTFANLRRKLENEFVDTKKPTEIKLNRFNGKPMHKHVKEKKVLEDMLTSSYLENELLKLKSTLAIQQLREKLHKADLYLDTAIEEQYYSPKKEPSDQVEGFGVAFDTNSSTKAKVNDLNNQSFESSTASQDFSESISKPGAVIDKSIHNYIMSKFVSNSSAHEIPSISNNEYGDSSMVDVHRRDLELLQIQLDEKIELQQMTEDFHIWAQKIKDGIDDRVLETQELYTKCKTLQEQAINNSIVSSHDLNQSNQFGIDRLNPLPGSFVNSNLVYQALEKLFDLHSHQLDAMQDRLLQQVNYFDAKINNLQHAISSYKHQPIPYVDVSTYPILNSCRLQPRNLIEASDSEISQLQLYPQKNQLKVIDDTNLSTFMKIIVEKCDVIDENLNVIELNTQHALIKVGDMAMMPADYLSAAMSQLSITTKVNLTADDGEVALISKDNRIYETEYDFDFARTQLIQNDVLIDTSILNDVIDVRNSPDSGASIIALATNSIRDGRIESIISLNDYAGTRINTLPDAKFGLLKTDFLNLPPIKNAAMRPHFFQLHDYLQQEYTNCSKSSVHKTIVVENLLKHIIELINQINTHENELAYQREKIAVYNEKCNDLRDSLLGIHKSNESIKLSNISTRNSLLLANSCDSTVVSDDQIFNTNNYTVTSAIDIEAHYKEINQQLENQISALVSTVEEKQVLISVLNDEIQNVKFENYRLSNLHSAISTMEMDCSLVYHTDEIDDESAESHENMDSQNFANEVIPGDDEPNSHVNSEQLILSVEHNMSISRLKSECVDSESVANDYTTKNVGLSPGSVATEPIIIPISSATADELNIGSHISCKEREELNRNVKAINTSSAITNYPASTTMHSNSSLSDEFSNVLFSNTSSAMPTPVKTASMTRLKKYSTFADDSTDSTPKGDTGHNISPALSELATPVKTLAMTSPYLSFSLFDTITQPESYRTNAPNQIIDSAPQNQPMAPNFNVNELVAWAMRNNLPVSDLSSLLNHLDKILYSISNNNSTFEQPAAENNIAYPSQSIKTDLSYSEINSQLQLPQQASEHELLYVSKNSELNEHTTNRSNNSSNYFELPHGLTLINVSSSVGSTPVSTNTNLAGIDSNVVRTVHLSPGAEDDYKAYHPVQSRDFDTPPKICGSLFCDSSTSASVDTSAAMTEVVDLCSQQCSEVVTITTGYDIHNQRIGGTMTATEVVDLHYQQTGDFDSITKDTDVHNQINEYESTDSTTYLLPTFDCITTSVPFAANQAQATTANTTLHVHSLYISNSPSDSVIPSVEASFQEANMSSMVTPIINRLERYYSVDRSISPMNDEIVRAMDVDLVLLDTQSDGGESNNLDNSAQSEILHNSRPVFKLESPNTRVSESPELKVQPSLMRSSSESSFAYSIGYEMSPSSPFVNLNDSRESERVPQLNSIESSLIASKITSSACINDTSPDEIIVDTPIREGRLRIKELENQLREQMEEIKKIQKYSHQWLSRESELLTLVEAADARAQTTTEENALLKSQYKKLSEELLKYKQGYIEKQILTSESLGFQLSPLVQSIIDNSASASPTAITTIKNAVDDFEIYLKNEFKSSVKTSVAKSNHISHLMTSIQTANENMNAIALEHNLLVEEIKSLYYRLEVIVQQSTVLKSSYKEVVLENELLSSYKVTIDAAVDSLKSTISVKESKFSILQMQYNEKLNEAETYAAECNQLKASIDSLQIEIANERNKNQLNTDRMNQLQEMVIKFGRRMSKSNVGTPFTPLSPNSPCSFSPLNTLDTGMFEETNLLSQFEDILETMKNIADNTKSPNDLMMSEAHSFYGSKTNLHSDSNQNTPPAKFNLLSASSSSYRTAVDEISSGNGVSGQTLSPLENATVTATGTINMNLKTLPALDNPSEIPVEFINCQTPIADSAKRDGNSSGKQVASQSSVDSPLTPYSYIITNSRRIDMQLRERLEAIGTEIEEEKSKVSSSPHVTRLSKRLDNLVRELELKTDMIQVMEEENMSVSARIRNLEDLCHHHAIEIKQINRSKDIDIRMKTEENQRLRDQIRELELSMAINQMQRKVVDQTPASPTATASPGVSARSSNVNTRQGESPR